MKTATIRLWIIFLVVLVGSGLLVYLLLDRGLRMPVNDSGVARSPAPETIIPESTPRPQESGAGSLLHELFGASSTAPTAPEFHDKGAVAVRVFLRFLIAALLATLLAFRWRRGLDVTKRNPYVAQTQILLAVVAAAMMMVVGDSAARAFGIFAAASLVRFRTNIRDPKETTVLLICLGVGLACGVGRLDMAAILAVFVLLALWVLEHFESGQVFRAMEVSVGTRNVDQTLKVLKDLFARHRFNPELRILDRPAEEGETGKIVYELSIGGKISTDQLTEEILNADANHVSSVEWDQKKSSTYIYN